MLIAIVQNKRSGDEQQGNLCAQCAQRYFKDGSKGLAADSCCQAARLIEQGYETVVAVTPASQAHAISCGY